MSTAFHLPPVDLLRNEDSSIIQRNIAEMFRGTSGCDKKKMFKRYHKLQLKAFLIWFVP
ncbi:unnamed protein product [Coffea canephora]|uniref:Uncharacterized protein n=1 Tax=Coffea canephora TaxID=49390 RepID=A0A068UXL0_COFCA|nr:unnamed protein product [Coffea canephora]